MWNFLEFIPQPNIFHPRLAEPLDVEPANMEGRLILLAGNRKWFLPNFTPNPSFSHILRALLNTHLTGLLNLMELPPQRTCREGQGEKSDKTSFTLVVPTSLQTTERCGSNFHTKGSPHTLQLIRNTCASKSGLWETTRKAQAGSLAGCACSKHNSEHL